jgi:hypothetical protein
MPAYQRSPRWTSAGVAFSPCMCLRKPSSIGLSASPQTWPSPTLVSYLSGVSGMPLALRYSATCSAVAFGQHRLDLPAVDLHPRGLVGVIDRGGVLVALEQLQFLVVAIRHGRRQSSGHAFAGSVRAMAAGVAGPVPARRRRPAAGGARGGAGGGRGRRRRLPAAGVAAGAVPSGGLIVISLLRSSKAFAALALVRAAFMMIRPACRRPCRRR